jgi:hypothetical protein
MFQKPKWVMRAHFRPQCFKSFPMILGTSQSNEFQPLQSPSENSGVHWDSNSQSGSSFGSVGFIPHTLLHSWEHEMWLLNSFLARTFVSPCLGCEPKVKVVTTWLGWELLSKWRNWTKSMQRCNISSLLLCNQSTWFDMNEYIGWINSTHWLDEFHV